jgi:hypothetical protein
MVARVCLGVAAALAAAWLGLSLRNDQLAIDGLKSSVFAAAAPSAGPVRERILERSLRQLHDAQLLNPDKTPAVYEGLVQTAQNREAGARKLTALARAHPDDAFYWAVLLKVVKPADPRSREARERLRMLIPRRPR